MKFRLRFLKYVTTRISIKSTTLKIVTTKVSLNYECL